MGELALASLREIADANRIAAARAQLAHLAILRRELAPAQSMAELALEQNQIIDESSGAIEALDLLSLIARLRGDTVRQSQLARQMLELTQRVSDPFAIASGLWTAAAIAAERGCFAEAARFYGAQEAVRLANGFAIDPGYSSDHAASVAAVRAALDARTFTDLWAEGRALVPAVALAAATSFLAEVADREQAAYQAEKRALQSLGLSDRQQDVLRLIGQGRSDREIADILSISARTVSKHVEAILMRLDAHTRSGATAIAARLAADARKRTPSTEHGSVR
jgi:DNA-binding CsgD family transcriptional regulator